jgi:hypothetical protein
LIRVATLYFDAGRRLRKARNVLGVQHNWHLARLMYELQVLGEVGAIEHYIEEEPQRRDSGVDLWHPYCLI